MSGGVSTHHMADAYGGYMGFSPNNFAIGQFDPINTHNFYSICIEPITHRCAVTLHVLLNDADRIAVNAVIAGPTDLHTFMQRIEANGPFAGRIGAPSIRGGFIQGRVNC